MTGISSDPNAWMRPIYTDLASRPGFATWSPHHQFTALVEAIAVEHPRKAAEMRGDGPTTQRAILGWLADVTTQRPAARTVELWRVQRPGRALRCLAVYLPTGIDLRLLDGDEFRRTQLCPDAPALQAKAEEWTARLLAAGWADGSDSFRA